MKLRMGRVAVATTAAIILAGGLGSRTLAQGSSQAPKLRAISGTVADKQGSPLSNAEVALVELDTVSHRTTTGDNGRFRLDAVPPGLLQLRVRRVGFQISHVTVDASPLDRSIFVALDPVVDVLDAVNVAGEETEKTLSPHLIEFYSRARSSHLGYFIDEQKLKDLHPQYTSDALRTVPGVIVRPSNHIGNDVKIRGCAPLIWVDGLRAKGAQLDDVTHGTDVAAIEVYDSLAGVPAQYSDRSATCGTILVWLKDR
jgi:carboxypeptidase family protein/TonB-dependent receptor-like protein